MLKDFKAKLSKIDILSPSVKHLVFDLEEEIEFKAGQFLNIIFEDDEQKYMKPYSICSKPSQKKQIEFCIKLVPQGKFTPVIFQKKIGFECILKGPLGLFTLEHSISDKVVFIGTGTGITPLRSMILDLLEKESEKEITLIFGVRHESEILYREEFKKLEVQNPNFKFLEVVSRPKENWIGRTGHVQNNLESIDVLNSEAYICGLTIMVEEVKENLLKRGMNKENIHFERYV